MAELVKESYLQPNPLNWLIDGEESGKYLLKNSRDDELSEKDKKGNSLRELAGNKQSLHMGSSLLN